MGDKKKYFIKRLCMDLSDGLSDSFDRMMKGRRIQSLSDDAGQFGDNLKDRFIDSKTGKSISKSLTNLYAFIKNRGAVYEGDNDDWDEIGIAAEPGSDDDYAERDDDTDNCGGK